MCRLKHLTFRSNAQTCVGNLKVFPKTPLTTLTYIQETECELLHWERLRPPLSLYSQPLRPASLGERYEVVKTKILGAILYLTKI